MILPLQAAAFGSLEECGLVLIRAVKHHSSQKMNEATADSLVPSPVAWFKSQEPLAEAAAPE